jgi:cytochrome b pre-mRNA-processing protein 3
MGLFDLFRRSQTQEADYRLYGAIVDQARLPTFYTDCGVPDTVGGRFDLIGLHAYLVMRCLKGMANERCAGLSQRLFDIMFADMDRNLREMGVGDLSVGKKVKELAKAFYGRVKAYDEGLAGGPDELEGALRRNLFIEIEPRDEDVALMAAYLVQSVAASSRWTIEQLEEGRLLFLAPPPMTEAADETQDGSV